MSNEKAGKLWIKTSNGPWAALDWKLLREWFALKWLPAETEVAEEKSGPWQPAQSVAKLWKQTQALAAKIREFEAIDLASKQVPLSRALRKRLVELGWPGNVELLKNYYWGNKLREELESLFPNVAREPFGDPDWPKCWSWPCPAEQLRQEKLRRNEPLTPAQDEVLRFFLGPSHGIISKGDAFAEIEDLLDDPDNEARWEDQKARIPATDKQRARLKWWSEKLGRRIPTPLMKAQASRLIDQWLEEHPELEAEWYAFKDQREDFETELSMITDDVNEWREFYNCKMISDKRVRNVVDVIGSRRSGEEINKFMDRFFAELGRQEPALFTRGRRAGGARGYTKPKGGCLVLCIALLLVAGVIGTLTKLALSR